MLNYRKLWKHFLEHEATEFEEVRKLTVAEIKRIGFKKFIRANDWRTIDDVQKWRTDVYDVIPCPHCYKDFGILDSHLGLCPKCYAKFDMKRFYDDVGKVETKSKATEVAGKMMMLFLGSKQFRDSYLKNRR